MPEFVVAGQLTRNRQGSPQGQWHLKVAWNPLSPVQWNEDSCIRLPSLSPSATKERLPPGPVEHTYITMHSLSAKLPLPSFRSEQWQVKVGRILLSLG